MENVRYIVKNIYGQETDNSPSSILKSLGLLKNFIFIHSPQCEVSKDACDVMINMIVNDFNTTDCDNLIRLIENGWYKIYDSVLFNSHNFVDESKIDCCRIYKAGTFSLDAFLSDYYGINNQHSKNLINYEKLASEFLSETIELSNGDRILTKRLKNI